MKKYYCYGKQTESTLHFMLLQREDEVDYKLVDFILLGIMFVNIINIFKIIFA